VALTSDDLVAAVRRLAFLPDASDLTSTDILAMADEELRSLVGELVKDSREEYWVVSEDTTLTSSRSYRIPRRAMDRTIRSVQFLDSEGRPVHSSEVDSSQPWGLTTDAFALVYYFEGDFLRLITTPMSGWSLRWRYLRRPSQLVPVASCAPIVSATNTTDIVCSSAPLTPASQYVDIVRGDAPFDLMYVDRVLKSVATLTYSLDASTPVDTADFVNRATRPNDRQDYICDRDTKCYPPLSASEFPVLAAAVARRALEELGDRAGAEAMQATLRDRMKASKAIIQPRNEQGSRALVNTSSRLRNGGFGRRWRS